MTTDASSHTPTSVDAILSARWIAPVDQNKTLLTDYSLVVHQQKILDILPTAQALKQYKTNHHSDLQDHLLIPGFINTHGHAAMSLMRGIADDLALQTWLEQHIWPIEAQFVDDSFVYDGTTVAIAEMLKNGTTTFCDMYFSPNASLQAINDHGIKATLFPPILDFPTPWAANANEYIEKALNLLELSRNIPNTSIGLGPHAPYTVSDTPLKEIAELSKQHSLLVQIHVHETAFEVSSSIEKHGIRPLERLLNLGVLGPQTHCVHMTQIDQKDIDVLKQTQSHVVHCPESNLKLASGFCPVHSLKQNGINVSLGTDGAASNNDLDMIGEMKTASLLAKGVAGDASALNCYEALEMATINGAKALGCENTRGSLEVGKDADIVAISMNQLNSQPLYNPISQLVYTVTRDQVTHVWINGKLMLENGQLTTLNEDSLLKKAKHWAQKLNPDSNTHQ